MHAPPCSRATLRLAVLDWEEDSTNGYTRLHEGGTALSETHFSHQCIPLNSNLTLSPELKGTAMSLCRHDRSMTGR